MNFFRKAQQEKPPAHQDLVNLGSDIDKAKLPEHVHQAALKVLERLEKTDAATAEYSIDINYLDYMISLPWNRCTDDNLDMARAEHVLKAATMVWGMSRNASWNSSRFEP